MPKPKPDAAVTQPDKPKKTPAQRAKDDLDVADRRVAKYRAALAALRGQIADAETDLRDSVKRRNYVALNPDLATPAAALNMDGTSGAAADAGDGK